MRVLPPVPRWDSGGGKDPKEEYQKMAEVMEKTGQAGAAALGETPAQEKKPLGQKWKDGHSPTSYSSASA